MIIRKSKMPSLAEKKIIYRWDSLAIKDGIEIWVATSSHSDENISAIIEKLSGILSQGMVDSWSEKSAPKLSVYDEYFDETGRKTTPSDAHFSAAPFISA